MSRARKIIEEEEDPREFLLSVPANSDVDDAENELKLACNRLNDWVEVVYRADQSVLPPSGKFNGSKDAVITFALLLSDRQIGLISKKKPRGSFEEYSWWGCPKPGRGIEFHTSTARQTLIKIFQQKRIDFRCLT